VSIAGRVIVFTAALLLWALPVAAEAPRVLLVRPQHTDPTITAAFNRIYGELMASGFTVVVHDETEGTSAKALAEAAKQEGAFASVTVVRSNGATTADVWITDRVTGKTTIRTISTTKRDAPELLAVRATDLLKVSLREFGEERPPADIASADPRQTLPVAVRAWAAEPESPWRLHAGVAAFGSFSQIKPGLGPTLGIGNSVHRRSELVLALHGPLLTPNWEAPEGRVSMRQELATLTMSWAAYASRALDFEVTAAFGGYHLSVTGQPDPPLVSRSDQVWALTFSPGVALAVRLSPSAEFRFSAAPTFLLPRPEVRIGETREPLGQPALLATAGLRVGM